MMLRHTDVAKPFTLDERAVFLDRLRVVEARTLLTIGAGQDSDFFAEAGLDVTAVAGPPDPAPPSGSFDAAYAVDVPGDEALPAIRAVLAPGGLAFLGLCEGQSADQELFGRLTRFFEVIDFHAVEGGGRHFQSATLVRPLILDPDA